MDRTEKIDAIVEFFDENHIKIIDMTSIGLVIVDAEQSLDKIDDKYEYDELLEKGLTDGDIEYFKKFLEKNTLMMIKTDNISGVSFENSEYYIDGLDETDLWRGGVEEDKKCDDGIMMETNMLTKEQLDEFFSRLEGGEGCDFKKDAEGEVTWKCEGGNDKSKAIEILKKMGISEKVTVEFLSLCESYGGYCDCEILFNAREHLLDNELYK